jgi:tetratricopeptide (TPR) repeat protein
MPLKVPAAIQTEAAVFSRALKLAQKKQYKKSRKLLFALTKKYPRNSLYWFNLGNIYYLLNDYDNAIRSYGNVIFLQSPLQPAAELYLARTYIKSRKPLQAMPLLVGLAQAELPQGLKDEVNSEREVFLEEIRIQALTLYRTKNYDAAMDLMQTVNRTFPKAEHYMIIGLSWLKQGKPRRARAAFRQAKELSEDQQLNVETENLLTQIREGTWDADKTFFPFFDLSVGYNSNVFLEAGENEPKSKAGYKILTAGTYHLLRRPFFFANLRYRLLVEEYENLKDDRFVSIGLSSQLIYAFAEWTCEVTPRAQQQSISTSLSVFKPGIFARMQKNLGHSDVGVTYDFTQATAAQNEISYLTGSSHALSFYWSLPTPTQQWVLFISIEKDELGQVTTPTDSLPLSYDGVAPGLRFVWFPNDLWELNSSASYSKKTYKPLAFPGGLQRDDNQTNFSTRLSYRLEKDLFLYVLGDLTSNRSTLSESSGKNKNHDQWSFFGGATWELSL